MGRQTIFLDFDTSLFHTSSRRSRRLIFRRLSDFASSVQRRVRVALGCSCYREEDSQRVKVIVSAVLLVPSEKLDENTAAAIAAVSRGPTGTVRIRMHNKLAALVVLGKYLGMFDERPQNTNAVYAISDKPMTDDEWVRRYVTPH